jgi:hypothetical protein
MKVQVKLDQTPQPKEFKQGNLYRHKDYDKVTSLVLCIEDKVTEDIGDYFEAVIIQSDRLPVGKTVKMTATNYIVFTGTVNLQQ